MDRNIDFMNGYLDKRIRITYLDNEVVEGVYTNYYDKNNVIVIAPEYDDTRILIPMSSIKRIEPC